MFSFREIFKKKAFRFSAAGRTDPGLVRQQNEDAFLVSPHGVFAVADGMGGHNAGEVASALAIDAVKASCSADALRACSGNAEEIHHHLIRTFTAANAIVAQKAARDENLAGMGCTLVVAVLDGTTLHVCHAGDARCYLADDTGIAALTRDHTATSETVSTSSGIAISPPVPRNIITMAIGFPFSRDPDYQAVEVKPGHRILLCSDGLWSMLAETELHDLLSNTAQPDDAARNLIDRANAAGGRDNITAVAIFL